MDSWNMLLQIILLLLACLLAGSLMAYLKQSPLVGYLFAGMIMGGPGSMAIVKAEQQIESIAELGVALLLFSLGLEFSWKRVMGLGKSTLLCGAAQVVVTLLIVAIWTLYVQTPTDWRPSISVMEAESLGSLISIFLCAGLLDPEMRHGANEIVFSKPHRVIVLLATRLALAMALLSLVIAALLVANRY